MNISKTLNTILVDLFEILCKLPMKARLYTPSPIYEVGSCESATTIQMKAYFIIISQKIKVGFTT